MKKLILLSSIIILSAFTCENEPLEGDFGTDDNISCEQAILNTIEAATNFALVSESDSNYTQLCVAYKNALEAQIIACGDEDGSLQTLVTSLGSCEGVNQQDDCDAATAEVDGAETEFNNANDDNYTQLCNAYKTALQNKIDACGDDGTIQTIINDLGDCTQSSSQGSITLTAGTLPIEFDIISVVEEGGMLKVTGNSSANGAGSYEIYFEVAPGATGVDIINSTFYLTLTSTLYPDTSGFDDFTSNITENTAGVITGTFGGIVTNADNGSLSLTSG
ncbi:MAG: hypothetical protein HKO92_01135, partial [Flavobacteriaceae bacterium]|nr:hypothetical protein [Flavobacteriaceae bacterium]